MIKTKILPLLLALPLALAAAPKLVFQAFDESFVKLDDFKSGTWQVSIEIDNKNLHFAYTARVKASAGPSADLRVSLEDIDFAVAYWDTPTTIDGAEHHFGMAEMVALWDDEPLIFTDSKFTLLPPYSKNRAATQSFAEGKKETDALISKTPTVRWARTFEKQIDRSFDDIWNHQEIADKSKAKKEEAALAAAAKAEEERQAKLEKERLEKERLDEERERRAAAKAKRDKARKSRPKPTSYDEDDDPIPEPEEVAEEAVSATEAYDAALAAAHLVSDERLRGNITWTMLAIGAVSTIVALVEHRNMAASLGMYNQYVALNPEIGFPQTEEDIGKVLMSQAYERTKNDHEMNRNISGALAAISLLTSFVVYKF